MISIELSFFNFFRSKNIYTSTVKEIIIKKLHCAAALLAIQYKI